MRVAVPLGEESGALDLIGGAVSVDATDRHAVEFAAQGAGDGGDGARVHPRRQQQDGGDVGADVDVDRFGEHRAQIAVSVLSDRT